MPCNIERQCWIQEERYTRFPFRSLHFSSPPTPFLDSKTPVVLHYKLNGKPSAFSCTWTAFHQLWQRIHQPNRPYFLRLQLCSVILFFLGFSGFSCAYDVFLRHQLRRVKERLKFHKALRVINAGVG